MRKLIPLIFFAFTSISVKSQSTFTQIHQLLQTNCAGASCHSGVTPTFNVTLSESAFYSALVNATPVNPTAAAKGDKLITPGYVDRSFLLRKIVHGLNENNIHMALAGTEGNNMPSGLPALAKEDIELVRQWILHGAPQTGDVVDNAVIDLYYSGAGKDDTYPAHEPPPADSGFQIYVGKILVPPVTEDYYYIKHDLRLTSNLEIPKVKTMLPPSTHHFVMYKFFPGGAANYADGLRPEALSSHADVSDGIGTGANIWEYDLPPSTAYFWAQNSILDLNLHIRNPSPDTVLACDLYMNIYTQPTGTATDFMLIRNYPVFTIAIPPDNVEHEFIEIANDTNETRYWKIWQLYGHTHKYGTDYDIFLRNPDGTMGTQEYESWYSYEQGFNVGYHRFGVDGTLEFFDDNNLLQVDPRLGFIHRARYKNYTSDTIFWGITSEEEMMVMGFQYIYGDLLSGIDNPDNNPLKVSVFPNPASDMISINYILPTTSDLKVELINILGEKSLLMSQKNKPAGNYLDEIEFPEKYAAGIYLVAISAGNYQSVQRIVIK